MQRLYYTSHLNAGLTADMLDDLIRHWRSRNAADDITGMLILEGRKLLQFIEGPRAAVDACFGRIARDRRHEGLDFTSSTLIDGRVFPDQPLGFHQIDDLPRDVTHSIRQLFEIHDEMNDSGFVDLQPEQDHVARLIRLFRTQMPDWESRQVA